MRTVTIRLSGDDFSAGIVLIREWLERHRCEPTGYRYDQDEDTVVMSVNFADHWQAKAFARRFGGQSSHGQPRISPAEVPRVVSNNTASNHSAITSVPKFQHPLSRSGGTAQG
jgi:hypothetical protein